MWYINMKDFLNSYKNSKYYPKLFEVDDDIIIAYVGGSFSFQTNHNDSDFDINVITNGGEFFSVYFDWHLKYKGRKVHWYYRPVVDFFKLTCYDLTDYIGVLTLLHIPQENVVYLNPKYEKQWNYLYENRDLLLKHICIELGISCKSFINFVLSRNNLECSYAQRTYFASIAAYYHLGISHDFELLKRVSKAKRASTKLSQEDFQEIKKLLSKFIESLKDFDLKTNRIELRALESKFKFIPEEN